MNSTKRVLVLDDEPGMCELLEIVLGAEGYDVNTFMETKHARVALEEESYDCVITDLRMGSDQDAGMEFLSWLQDRAAGIPSIMITAHGSVETAIEAMKRGAADYIMKPFSNDEIKLLVKRAIEQRNLVRENLALRKEQARLGRVENMVGVSPAIERVREMIRRVAILPSTIAIYGESGVGKELVARSVHELSERADKPFVAINCGGIPENLLESELFGHKKGAFTGAVEDKDGLFVTADGGTLFLDEIGEMPLSLQVKLLRVLDNGVLTPLGGTHSVKVDVRLVSATNRDLEELAKQGNFREDLFYRLNVIPIFVPPLRERRDDIPLLIRHFVKKHATKMGRKSVTISEDCMGALCAYDWPGNVRELGNVIERAVALSMGDMVEAADLPTNIRDFMPNPIQGPAHLPSEGLDLEELITDIEKDLIQKALHKTKHSQKKAAKLLNLTPRSLRYRLQKYGLNGHDDDDE